MPSMMIGGIRIPYENSSPITRIAISPTFLVRPERIFFDLNVLVLHA